MNINIDSILRFVVHVGVLLFAVSVHESAHGWMAEKFGDPTARNQGRITLNPIAHIDLVGSIIFPIILYYTSGFVFGWAKPVMVNPYNLRDPRRADIYISAAGPVSNLIAAFVGTVIFLLLKRVAIGLLGGPDGLHIVGMILFYSVIINVILAIFNLIPVPPLDGSHILEDLLKGDALYNYQKIKPYGFIILILIIFTGIFGKIAFPILSIVQNILLRG